jgi:hypothetical protein
MLHGLVTYTPESTTALLSLKRQATARPSIVWSPTRGEIAKNTPTANERAILCGESPMPRIRLIFSFIGMVPIYD